MAFQQILVKEVKMTYHVEALFAIHIHLHWVLYELVAFVCGYKYLE